MKIDLEILKNSLSNNIHPPILNEHDHHLKISSVIIPLYFYSDGTVTIILTKRSEKLRSHKGQISFPGGKYSKEEDNENLLNTALREWEEETGKSIESIKILGRYKDARVRTGYHITPFIGIYNGDLDFQNINQNEVEYMIFLKLDELENIPFYYIPVEDKYVEALYYFQLEKEILWGATCHIIYNFIRDFCNFQRQPILAKFNISVPPFFDPRLITKDS